MPVPKMTSKQFEEKILELQALIQDHTAVWHNDTKDKQMARKKKAAEDPFYSSQSPNGPGLWKRNHAAVLTDIRLWRSGSHTWPAATVESVPTA